jgi:hypothetical protein
MAVFCGSLTSWFPGMLLTYFLNDLGMVPVAPITTGIIVIIIIIIMLLFVVVFVVALVSCHRPFLPGTSLKPMVIPTTQVSSFSLQFPYYV